MNDNFFFEENGFIKLNKFLVKNTIFLNFRNFFFKAIFDVAKHNNLNISKVNDNNIDQVIFDLKKINDKNIQLIHETINSLPQLNYIFSSKKLNSYIKKILLIEKKTLTFINNYSFRIQVPGRDEVSNLPWHRDSLYNNSYIKDNSIVVWISLSNIRNEMGPIVFKKGSQKIHNVNKKIVYKRNKKKIFSIERKKKWIDIKDTTLETKIGDVILIDMNTIHKSGTNLSKFRTKLSAQARFHFFSETYIKKKLII
jgi:ectoine hydroxylase-related dioxygenase (phytanoyl-CoA dioxygenase family)